MQVGSIPGPNADGVSQLAFEPSSCLPYVARLTYVGSSMDDSWFSKVSVMRFHGNKQQWVPVGPDIVTLGDYYSFAIHPTTSMPFVAYETCDSTQAFTVVRFTGSAWVPTMSDGIPPKTYACNGLVLAFQPNTAAAHVAFTDNLNNGAATVMRFTGTKWSTLGPAGFSVGEASELTLEFQPNTSLPYVAYQERWRKATVMRFNGSKWVAVGATGFTAGAAGYLSFAFNPTTSEPYVAFAAAANNDKATVMRFTGGAWRPVGKAGFSYGAVRYISLAFPTSSEAQPYVAFSAAANYWRATVMRFTGSAWVAAGPTGFSAEQADFIDLVFNPRPSKPYVSYRGLHAVKVMSSIAPTLPSSQLASHPTSSPSHEVPAT